ncbi:SPASM domain-containing protein [Arcobacter sp. FWKO B]|uniref:radical SAM protein n=1 Tax=Arcobacter sp. FWKO B TaxID=2593672 RepID=UPI0018A5308C|nr:radical SAM protein [Arcobacter sp. FWKO B]QOG12168.1 hypothetical protein FWKOB_05385 [Arcobacter sp. FWKO B]
MNNKEEVLNNFNKWFINFDYKTHKARMINDYYLEPICENAQIHVTRKCNFTCVQCTRQELYGDSNQAPNMDFELFKTILNKLPKSVKNIDMTSFGEAGMHPNYEEMLQLIKASGRTLSAFCNGSMFKLSHLKYFDTLIFSLDGVNKELLERIRKGVNGNNLLQKIIDTVQLRNKEKYNTNIQINFIMGHENASDITNVFEFCEVAGIDELRLTPYLNLYSPLDEGWHDMNKELVKSNDFVDWKWTIDSYCNKNYNFKLTAWYPRDNYKGICLYGAWRVVIDVDGSLRDCCFYYNNNPRVFGNLKEQSFEEIFYGEEMSKFREAHMNDLPLDNCDGCNLGKGIR